MMMQMLWIWLWLWLRLATFLELIETPEDFNEGSGASASASASSSAAAEPEVAINALSMHAACNVQQTVQVATTLRFATVVFVLGLFKLTNNAAGSGSQRAIHNNDGAAAAAAAWGMRHVACGTCSTRSLECCRTSVAKYLANMA